MDTATADRAVLIVAVVVRLSDVDIVIVLALPSSGRGQSPALGQRDGCVGRGPVVLTVDVLAAGRGRVLLTVVEVLERTTVIGV
jgi:hypothetical protein